MPTNSTQDAAKTKKVSASKQSQPKNSMDSNQSPSINEVFQALADQYKSQMGRNNVYPMDVAMQYPSDIIVEGPAQEDPIMKIAKQIANRGNIPPQIAGEYEDARNQKVDAKTLGEILSRMNQKQPVAPPPYMDPAIINNYPTSGQLHGYPEEPREIVPISDEERSMYQHAAYVPQPNAPQYYLPGGLGVAERAAPIVGPDGQILRQAVSTTPNQLDLPVREADLPAYRRMIHEALFQKYK